jgi:hypothetical protein
MSVRLGGGESEAGGKDALYRKLYFALDAFHRFQISRCLCRMLPMRACGCVCARSRAGTAVDDSQIARQDSAGWRLMKGAMRRDSMQQRLEPGDATEAKGQVWRADRERHVHGRASRRASRQAAHHASASRRNSASRLSRAIRTSKPPTQQERSLRTALPPRTGSPPQLAPDLGKLLPQRLDASQLQSGKSRVGGAAAGEQANKPVATPRHEARQGSQTSGQRSVGSRVYAEEAAAGANGAGVGAGGGWDDELQQRQQHLSDAISTSVSQRVGRLLDDRLAPLEQVDVQLSLAPTLG